MIYQNFSKKFSRVLVTGGCGFIGSCLIRNLLTKTNSLILNIDSLTYSGSTKSIDEVLKKSSLQKNRYTFSKNSINNLEKVKLLINNFKPEIVFHLAAETHVDASIINPKIFIENNINGTFNLLDATYQYWKNLSKANKRSFIFIHVSTDEVFGSLGREGYFTEESRYKPRSPYSASKASSDHLVEAWNSTYELPTLITNCSNNYGPWQYPEKLIPLIIKKAIKMENIPIYGNGKNIRDWLFVQDHINALFLAAIHGKAGDRYCIGGNNEKSNLEIAKYICKTLDNIFPEKKSHEKLITFVSDRPGHDFRYAINNSLIKSKLGWVPEYSFEKGIKETILWYVNNNKI